MSSAVDGSPRSARSRSSRGSARFGATVRGVLLSPGSAFVPALKRVESSAEARSTYVLAALGGAAAMVLWLKVRALVGFRPLSPSDFHWGVFAAALVFAAIVAVGAQLVWSFAAPAAGGPDAGSPRSFRAVWSLAAFPQIAALFLLVPLDVLLVGEGAFAASEDADSVALAWTALSTAGALSLAAWSAFVFAKGTHVATRAPVGRTAAVIALGVVCVAVVVAVLGGALVALREVAG